MHSSFFKSKRQYTKKYWHEHTPEYRQYELDKEMTKWRTLYSIMLGVFCGAILTFIPLKFLPFAAPAVFIAGIILLIVAVAANKRLLDSIRKMTSILSSV